VLIECTATDLTKAGVVVDTVVAMFAEYCKEPFTYEPVEIVYPNGEKMVYPLMPYRKTEVCMHDARLVAAPVCRSAHTGYCNGRVQVTTEYINNCIGVELSEDEICKLLNKMALKSVTPAPGVIQSEIPPIRHDILHACDVMEDVAIAHGYNNIEKVRVCGGIFLCVRAKCSQALS
jgi:phenylalanyl-tRNA synthetase beta chain